MKKNKSPVVFLLFAGISLCVLITISKYCVLKKAVDLQTAMDVATAAVVDETSPEANASDVVTQELEESIKETDAEDVQKRKQVVALVEEAIDFVQKNSLDQAMNAFTHNRHFLRGELYLFVYDTNGFQYANGQDERYIWKNLSEMRDTFGTYIVKEIIKKAKGGGGWVTYQWRNATKISYVKLFKKDGKEFAVGAGYYPHSKRDVVVGLVKAAVAYFNDIVVDKGFLIDEVFSTLSFPVGRFVMGDLYLYAISFNGQMLANGDRPGLIGTNVMNVRDAEGKFTNQEIINKLKNTTEGIWLEYQSKNALKLTYAEKVTDREGKQYFIACGYYPSAVPNKAVDLVKGGYEFMKKHGLTAAVAEFSGRQTDTYRYGDLYLIVWDMNGKVIAHGNNMDTIGLNQWDLLDEDGKAYVQEIIKKASSGGGWVDFKLKNAFQSIYVEKVDLGTDSFVIGSGLYPISKRETAILLARSAAGYLQTNPLEKAFSDFTDVNGKFIRGDLFVFVVDFDGICQVWGDSFELIWRNIMGALDDTGKPYIQVFINTVRQGSGQVTYHINGQEKVALLEMVEKDKTFYVLGTGYYK
jgi:signal transduction histidine kinase